MTGTSVALSLNSSARTSARPQTHEPGDGETGWWFKYTGRDWWTERGKQNKDRLMGLLVRISKSLCRLIIIN